jgi:hypothetical protein
MLVAHGASLKTWTALSMALAVSKGEKWLGRYSTVKGRAVILDYENGQHEIGRRIGILARGQALPDFGYARDDRPLTDRTLWNDLAASGAKFVIVDGLAAGSAGVDENATEAARPLQLARLFTDATGGVVLFIHHANKADNSDKRLKVRGSSAIFASLDACYEFDVTGTSAKVSCTKMRTGRQPAPFDVRLSDAEGLAFAEKSITPPSVEVEGMVKMALRDGPLTKTELGRRVGKRDADVRGAVQNLIERRAVYRNADGQLALDDTQKREERIVEAVRAYDGDRASYIATPQKLAARAKVTPDDVNLAIQNRKIAQVGVGFVVSS